MNAMLEKVKKTRGYLNYIEDHYYDVQSAWEELKPKLKNINYTELNLPDIDKNYDEFISAIDSEIKHHDLSKLSAEEFIQYRERFFPINDHEEMDSVEEFGSAWENHKEVNQHHWQNWRNIYNENNKMVCIVENVVDWMAVGYNFGNSALEYYHHKKSEIKISKSDRMRLERVLRCTVEVVEGEE